MVAAAERVHPRRITAPHRVHDALVVAGGSAVCVLAVMSFVVVPRGEPSMTVRLGRLVAIGVVAGVTSATWRRAGGRARAALEIAVGVAGVLGAGIASLARASELPLAQLAVAIPAVGGSLVLFAVGVADLLGPIRARW